MTRTTAARLADDVLAMLLLGGLGCVMLVALFHPDTAPQSRTPTDYAEVSP